AAICEAPTFRPTSRFAFAFAFFSAELALPPERDGSETCTSLRFFTERSRFQNGTSPPGFFAFGVFACAGPFFLPPISFFQNGTFASAATGAAAATVVAAAAAAGFALRENERSFFQNGTLSPAGFAAASSASALGLRENVISFFQIETSP